MQHGVHPGLQISHSPLRHSASSSAASIIWTSSLSRAGRELGIALGYRTRRGLNEVLFQVRCYRSREWIVGNGIDEAEAQRLFGVEFFGREEHLQSTCSPDQTRKTLCPAPAGDEPESCSAMSEDGVRPGDAVAARKRKVESSAHAITMNGGNSWGREILDRCHELLTYAQSGRLP